MLRQRKRVKRNGFLENTLHFSRTIIQNIQWNYGKNRERAGHKKCKCCWGIKFLLSNSCQPFKESKYSKMSFE